MTAGGSHVKFRPAPDSVAEIFCTPVPSGTSQLPILVVFLIAPLSSLAQGSPFDSGFTNLQTLFTGTVAKVASLIAIVIGGYGFAHGEPGAKKALAWPQSSQSQSPSRTEEKRTQGVQFVPLFESWCCETS